VVANDRLKNDLKRERDLLMSRATVKKGSQKKFKLFFPLELMTIFSILFFLSLSFR
jgi:hypothetical protein